MRSFVNGDFLIPISRAQSKYLPDGVSRGGAPFGGDAPGAGGAGGDRDRNMFGEPL
jgi:hypothetical protein